MKHERLYGITHRLDGTEIEYEPKILKVSIGTPRGPAIHTWIEEQDAGANQWHIKAGAEERTFENLTEAAEMYAKARPKCPTRANPARLKYFTFTRPDPDGGWIHDLTAIQAHGARPTEIDIVLVSDDPLECSWGMWGRSELKCSGDGRTAERVLAMASTEDEKRAAAEAEAAGVRTFVVSTCAATGCPYVQGDQAKCKPTAYLKFQVAKHIRLGGTAFFFTTGKRSIRALFANLKRFRGLTHGTLLGVHCKLIVGPYKQKRPTGQTVELQGVRLDVRGEDLQEVRDAMARQAALFRQALPIPSEPTKSLPEPTGLQVEPIIDAALSEGQTAGMVHAEFYPADDAEEVLEDGEITEVSHEPGARAADATESKRAGLLAKLAKRSEGLKQESSADDGGSPVPESGGGGSEDAAPSTEAATPPSKGHKPPKGFDW
jgi:hypothetical protein